MEDNFEVMGDWPSRSSGGVYLGKFLPGQEVEVVSKFASGNKRFGAWIGKRGFVVDWRRTGGYSGQSEYQVYDPETGRLRWIWSDALVEV